MNSEIKKNDSKLNTPGEKTNLVLENENIDKKIEST